MKIATLLYQNLEFTKEINKDNLLFEDVQLVLGFGSGSIITDEQNFLAIQNKFPNATISLCSTAGEIFEIEVFDNSISLVVFSFSTSYIKTAVVNIDKFNSSFEAGKQLVNQLPKQDLKLIFVLSDGGKVNGSELVKGLNSINNNDVIITGGMAGDGADFRETFVGLNSIPQSGNIVVIGFYGKNLSVSHGSFGGWKSFGLERVVTKSIENVLYEIDNKNALDLYKSYLGKYSNELPGSALLFPLSIQLENKNETIVRTILSIDENNQTMTFAGDIPEGSKVRFMKANFDHLIHSASDAAINCLNINSETPKIALLISCVGRKLILGNRIDEEVEAVSEIFGKETSLVGFYSYGEISPLKPLGNCELHNQTMTITCIDETENTEHNKLLKKQISKFFTEDQLQNPALLNFLNVVDTSYSSFERDNEIITHAFYESEKEYQILNENLKFEYELKKQSISKLYESINLIEKNNLDVNDKKDDLFYISNHLNQQIEIQNNNELAIKSLLSLQQMLIGIASDFINVPFDKIEELKNQTLKRLGEFVSADRAYIFQYDFKNQTCSNTFEWCNYNIEPQIENLQNIPLDLMQDWVNSNISGEIMSIPSVDDLPDNNLKQILSQQDIKSLLVLPVIGKDECLGFVGFDSVKSHYNYSNEEKDLLFFFAQMISNVDQRHKVESDLKYKNELQKTLLSNIQSGIVFEDENNIILFANQLFCDLFTISACPESLIGLDCADCMMNAKKLFVESEEFTERIFDILNKKEIVVNEIIEINNGIFLERDYVPLFINNEYKGHLWKYTDITHRVKSQLLLEQSEERNRLITESALNAIINIDSSGNITFWNKQAEEIFGWKREEVIGKKLQDNIIPIQHKASHADGLKRYIECGEGPALNKLLEFPAVKKDGTEVLLEMAIIPIKQGDELFFCSFIQDISERKKAENQLKFQEKKYRNIIANMNLGLIEVDNNDLIQFANQSFCNISGFDMDEIIGKNPTNIFVDGENKNIIDSKIQLRNQGKSDIYQIPVKNKKGESKWWAISGAPNYDENGQLVGTIGIHLDITDQKLLEIELEKEKQRAIDASKAKEVFLSTMSHEIRTPLNAIIGFLRELSKHSTSQEQKTYLENSTIASSHLLSIINDVLDISKIESGEMELESNNFDLKHSVEKVVTILEVKAKEKGLELKSNFNSGISNLLIGDSFRIEQILYNLIGNSLKFTTEGSIYVQCDLIQDFEEEQELLISISDTGIGIEESYLETIFTKFSQEEKDTSRKFGGTGLGMAITKELVDLMGGNITIESKKNTGTKINVFLKLTKAIMKENCENNEENILNHDSLENKKVLLVEDNEFNRIVAQNTLRFFKCEVVEAINGLDALEKVKQGNFDVILMDVQMPIMDGIEATKIIREDLKINTPIIALTANAFKTEIERFKRVGINDYITKPFDENILYQSILKVISTNELSKINNVKLNYDLSNIIALSRGDNKFVEKMIELFIKQTIEACTDLDYYVSKNNFNEISKIIHKIKPNIEFMGITSIMDQVRELEKLSQNSNDIDRIKFLVTEIITKLNDAITELKIIKRDFQIL